MSSAGATGGDPGTERAVGHEVRPQPEETDARHRRRDALGEQCSEFLFPDQVQVLGLGPLRLPQPPEGVAGGDAGAASGAAGRRCAIPPGTSGWGWSGRTASRPGGARRGIVAAAPGRRHARSRPWRTRCRSWRSAKGRRSPLVLMNVRPGCDRLEMRRVLDTRRGDPVGPRIPLLEVVRVRMPLVGGDPHIENGRLPGRRHRTHEGPEELLPGGDVEAGDHARASGVGCWCSRPAPRRSQPADASGRAAPAADLPGCRRLRSARGLRGCHQGCGELLSTGSRPQSIDPSVTLLHMSG